MFPQINFAVCNKSYMQFSQDFGYTYLPDLTTEYAIFDQGLPSLLRFNRSNAKGNCDRDSGDYASAELKILAFGDSQTMYQVEAHCWTDVLQGKIQERTGKNTSVMNFGREGYGILQMIDLAQSKIAELKPDLVLMGFITADLGRARYWCSHQDFEGYLRFFRTAFPSEEFVPGVSLDVQMIHPDFSLEWVLKIRRDPDENDPVLQDLYRQREIYRKSYESFGNRTDSGVHHQLSDFREDERFVAGLEKIKKFSCPVLNIHLPRHDELVQNTISTTPREQILLQSYIESLGSLCVLHPLYRKYSERFGPIAELFVSYPVDQHPSLKGFEFYAESIAAILEMKGMI